MNKKENAFTLIEVLLVIAISAIIMSPIYMIQQNVWQISAHNREEMRVRTTGRRLRLRLGDQIWNAKDYDMFNDSVKFADRVESNNRMMIKVVDDKTAQNKVVKYKLSDNKILYWEQPDTFAEGVWPSHWPRQDAIDLTGPIVEQAEFRYNQNWRSIRVTIDLIQDEAKDFINPDDETISYRIRDRFKLRTK